MYDRFSFGCVIRILIWLRNGIVPNISFMIFFTSYYQKRTKHIFPELPLCGVGWGGGISGAPRGLERLT
jgi:hypothetical protein